jgi:NAD(P)-dependent dehydrogenase (short-subunit alcohol dehydrogenase family)
MKRALVIGASGGIGNALVQKLRQDQWDATTLSRSGQGLDLANETAVERVLGSLSGPFDLIIVASGALEIDGAAPEKTIRTISARAMMDQFALNAVGPALVLRAAPRLLRRDGRAVFAVLSARVGSIGDNRLGGWISYRAAKAAVNQIVHTGAIELARSHRESICVSLHPGTVRTNLTVEYAGRHRTVTPDEAAANLLAVIDGLTPADTGGFFDWAGNPVPW